MRKVIVKQKVQYTEEGARFEAVFADTQESAGYVAGWSGQYLAARLNGEKKEFAKLKDAKEFLASQPVKKAEPIMKGRKVIGEGQNKRLTKAQMKKYGII